MDRASLLRATISPWSLSRRSRERHRVCVCSGQDQRGRRTPSAQPAIDAELRSSDPLVPSRAELLKSARNLEHFVRKRRSIG
jgi:hypothetical protein